MLKIENLHKRFGDVHALDDVSLELKPGLFGLLGPNGAGKSTLMRTLATLQKPDSGTVHLDRVDILQEPTAMRRVLGYLPQDFGVYPRMSALALLDHMAILKGINDNVARKEQIDSLLHAVNLYTHRTASVATYSGGMRQRFGVAQAMLGDPKVLIVDEPTAGLDPFERQRFLDLLSEAGEDKIIILSTHIVEDVLDLCPDMAILGDGKIVARGAPKSLIEKIDGYVYSKMTTKAGAELILNNPDLAVLSTRLKQASMEVRVLADYTLGNGFEAVSPTLQDAYFAHLNGYVYYDLNSDERSQSSKYFH